MKGYTRKGYKLACTPGTIFFTCLSEAAFYPREGTYERAAGCPIATLQVMAPCAKGVVTDTLRAWVSVYGDEELLAQVAAVVDEAFARLSEVASARSPAVTH